MFLARSPPFLTCFGAPAFGIFSSSFQLRSYHHGKKLQTVSSSSSSSPSRTSSSQQSTLASSDDHSKGTVVNTTMTSQEGTDDIADDLSSVEDWIPPNRPLVGDQGQSHLYNKEIDDEFELQLLEQQIKRLEREEEPQKPEKGEEQAPQSQTAMAMGQAGDWDQPRADVDWLATRRSMLAPDDGQPPAYTSGVGEATDMMRPRDATTRRNEMTDAAIEAKHHMLLSHHEIVHCLSVLGGRDATVVYDGQSGRKRMGGQDGIIVVTATHRGQLRILAQAIIRQLRRRNLQECNVTGARDGHEGDATDTSWLVVDCGNWDVHIQDPDTRAAVDLVGLWSGKDKLHTLDLMNEDEVEDYVAANPVPSYYGRATATMAEWDETLKKLQKNRWTAPHKPILARRRTATSKTRRVNRSSSRRRV